MNRSIRSKELFLLPLLWLPFALLVRRFWFVCDDAFISFRYARNLAAGEGLRYNPGEQPPVEGYSDFLWVLIASVFHVFRMEITLWPLLLSALCGALLLWLLLRLLIARFEFPPAVAFLTILSLALFPPFALWASGGLETMPFALLLVVGFERMILRREGPAAAAGALACLAAALLRVEGIAWGVLIGLFALRPLGTGRQEPGRRMVPFFAILLAGFALYYAWRFAYYGEPVANTVYVKAGLSQDTIARGIRYVLSFILVFPAILLAIPGAIVMAGKTEKRIAFPLVLFPLCNVAWAVATGGDWMAMGRFLLPGLVLFGFLLYGWLLKSGWTGSPRRKTAVAALALAVIGANALPAWNRHPVPEPVRAALHFRYNTPGFRSEFAQWAFMKSTPPVWKRTALAVREIARPGDTCVSGAIGAIGYYSDLFVYDTNGLVTPEVARGEGPAIRRSPGHDKHVPFTHFLDREPAFLLHLTAPMPRPVLLSSARAWRSGEWGDRYVMETIPLGKSGIAGPEIYSVFYRRLGREEDPDKVWARFFASFS